MTRTQRIYLFRFFHFCMNSRFDGKKSDLFNKGIIIIDFGICDSNNDKFASKQWHYYSFTALLAFEISHVQFASDAIVCYSKCTNRHEWIQLHHIPQNIVRHLVCLFDLDLWISFRDWRICCSHKGSMLHAQLHRWGMHGGHRMLFLFRCAENWWVYAD